MVPFQDTNQNIHFARTSNLTENRCKYNVHYNQLCVVDEWCPILSLSVKLFMKQCARKRLTCTGATFCEGKQEACIDSSPKEHSDGGGGGGGANAMAPVLQLKGARERGQTKVNQTSGLIDCYRLPVKTWGFSCREKNQCWMIWTCGHE